MARRSPRQHRRVMLEMRRRGLQPLRDSQQWQDKDPWQKLRAIDRRAEKVAALKTSKTGPTGERQKRSARNGYFAWVAGASNAFSSPAPSWGKTREEATALLQSRGNIYPGQYIKTATWTRAPRGVHAASALMDDTERREYEIEEQGGLDTGGRTTL